jgi:anti-sigma factor RsiW
MDCKQAELLIHAYVDGELDLSGALTLEAHLKGCAQCRAKRDEISALSRQLRAELERYSAPKELRERLALATPTPARAPSSASSHRRWDRRQFMALAASVVVAVLSSSGATYWAVRPSLSPRIAEEVVASHVRSLMPNHLIDVASSDQHTVKPWFDGKLDEAPAVVDLTRQGFPLVGGRLDYIGKRPVAALVYGHKKHFINLFACPTSGGEAPDPTPKARTIRGYNVLYWTTGDIAYWAVSDVDPSALDAFRSLFQRSAATVPD